MSGPSEIKTYSIRSHSRVIVDDIKPPIFRNRKDWRRYRVVLKRVRERIDQQILDAISRP